MISKKVQRVKNGWINLVKDGWINYNDKKTTEMSFRKYNLQQCIINIGDNSP